MFYYEAISENKECQKNKVLKPEPSAKSIRRHQTKEEIQAEHAAVAARSPARVISGPVLHHQPGLPEGFRFTEIPRECQHRQG